MLRCLLTTALLALAPAGVAAADTMQPPREGPLPRSALAKPFEDRVITGDPPARAAQAPAGRRATFRTPDGFDIEIETSSSYPDTPANRAATQGVADFLGSRVHGQELGRLRVFVGRPVEIQERCGSSQAVACYYTREARMFIPGERDASGVPVEYAITHEYGHHLATFRRNALGPAFLLGAQYWATEERICDGIRRREFKPGDQEDGYLDNPGEGFADAYAHLPEHYPNAPFQYNRKFFPAAAGVAALRRDIAGPWRRPRVDRFSGSLGSRRAQQRFRVPVSQDGEVVARLRVPRGARFDLQVLAGGRVVDTASRRGTQRRVSGTLCAPANGPHPSLALRVVRRSGSGSFSLTSSVAG